MRVRMKVGISGGRGDGTDWPNVGGTLEVPDAEGKDLCGAGMAEQVDDERPAKVEPEPPHAPPVETATVDDESETSTPLTTTDGPVKRGPGRPRKNP